MHRGSAWVGVHGMPTLRMRTHPEAEKWIVAVRDRTPGHRTFHGSMVITRTPLTSFVLTNGGGQARAAKAVESHRRLTSRSMRVGETRILSEAMKQAVTDALRHARPEYMLKPAA